MTPDELPDLDALLDTGALHLPVDLCPRCNQEHASLPFRALKEPSDAAYWATCPETGELLLLGLYFS